MTPARTLPQWPKPETNTKPKGEKKKGHLSLIKGSIGHRNIHIHGHGYTYRSINSVERVHLEIHKITIIDKGPRLG